MRDLESAKDFALLHNMTVSIDDFGREHIIHSANYSGDFFSIRFANYGYIFRNGGILSVMRDYYDVTRPYIEINDIQVEKKGFGRYTLGISVTNNIKSRNIGIENVWVDLEQGKYKNWQDSEMLLVERLGELCYLKNRITEMR